MTPASAVTTDAAEERATGSAERIAQRVSTALVIVALITSLTSFFFWRVFHRDVPMGVGNLRGTALAMLVIAVPVLIASMVLAARGSMRARFAWLGCLAYIAYNAVMFCFAAHFNSYFLLFTTLLALSFWSLLTLLRAFDLAAVRTATAGVATRTISVYLLVCAAVFALLWLQTIVPATVHNTMPIALEEAGLTQNPVWVLDFAFTFPLMLLGSLWLWRRRPWGYIIGGMMVIMLTIETAGIALDQVFGQLHDPSASLSAVPVMLVFTGAGLVLSALFLHGVRETRTSAAVR